MEYSGITKRLAVVDEAYANIDALYGPYESTQEANLSIPLALRAKGKTVGIIVNGVVIEYWYSNGVGDEHLIKKSIDEKEISKSIANSIPDEEDLTSFVDTNGDTKIREADRKYVANSMKGKGDKILRMNVIENINVLTQAMVAEENTVYNIRYDYDLQGTGITLGKNSTLKFVGGSISNGSINGNNTSIEGVQGFGENMVFYGTWDDVRCSLALWRKDVTDIRKFEMAILLASKSTQVVFVPSGTYELDRILTGIYRVSIEGEHKLSTIINYSGEEAAFEIKDQAGQLYSERTGIANLTLKYTGDQTKRVAAIQINDTSISTSNYFRSVIAEDFTSYIIRFKGAKCYLQNSIIEDVRGKYVGGFIGYYDHLTPKAYIANTTTIKECSMDSGLNTNMVEPIFLDLRGWGITEINNLVMQGRLASALPDGWALFKAGFILGNSANHRLIVDRLWVEYIDATSIQKSITISADGGAFDIREMVGVRHIVVDSTVQSWKLGISTNQIYIENINDFIIDNSTSANREINFTAGVFDSELGADLTNDTAKYQSDWQPNNFAYQSPNISTATQIAKQYGIIRFDASYYDSKRELMEEGGVLFTRFSVLSPLIVTGQGTKISPNSRYITVMRCRLNFDAADWEGKSESEDYYLTFSNSRGCAVDVTPRQRVPYGTLQTDWFTVVCYQVSKNETTYLEGFVKALNYKGRIDISHLIAYKGNNVIIDGVFLTQNPKTIEVNVADIELVKDATTTSTYNVVASDGEMYNKTPTKFTKKTDILAAGATRPDINQIDIGSVFFDTNLSKPIYWIGYKWVDATGADV